MKICSGHLTLIVIVGALLAFAHMHQEDIIRLAQAPHDNSSVQQQTDPMADDNLHPTFGEDGAITEYRSQCWFPEADEFTAPRERELIMADGTVRRVTEPVWRQTVHVPRAVQVVEFVDPDGNRWRLISGGTEGLQKEVPLTGRIAYENGQTYFVQEDARICYGRWQLVSQTR